jgi:hypothetical protein
MWEFLLSLLRSGGPSSKFLIERKENKMRKIAVVIGIVSFVLVFIVLPCRSEENVIHGGSRKDLHQTLAHDIICNLNEEESSPLHKEIKIMGVGKGRVSEDSLAEEMVDLFANIEKVGGTDRFKEFEQNGERFFLNYFKAILTLFPRAWGSPKCSIKTEAALRAFIRVTPDVIARSGRLRNDAFGYFGIREAIKPWGERVGERRFETNGEWQKKLAGGTEGTVELLARELRDAIKGL